MTVGARVFVGPHAVVRADEPGSSISIGRDCNIQDGVIIHSLCGSAVKVGKRSSLSHGVLVHGPCGIGDDCFIGFKSVVFRSRLANGVFVKYSSVIENVTVPSGRFIGSLQNVDAMSAVKALRHTTQKERRFSLRVVRMNNILLRSYRGLRS